MKALNTLRAQAEMSAIWRGHSLRWLAPHHGEARSYQNGECVRCGASVTVNTHPMPNEIDVGGDAVAVGCGAAYVPEDTSDMEAP